MDSPQTPPAGPPPRLEGYLLLHGNLTDPLDDLLRWNVHNLISALLIAKLPGFLNHLIFSTGTCTIFSTIS